MSQLTRTSETQNSESPIRKFFMIIDWVFPFILAFAAYIAASNYEPASSLKTSVFQLPVPQEVYLWLLVLVLAAVVWLVFEFISVTSRETIVASLQLDVAVSTFTALLFSGFGGWLIGNDQLQWWFAVPWAATLIDAMTAGHLAVNKRTPSTVRTKSIRSRSWSTRYR